MSAPAIANIVYGYNIWPFRERLDEVGVRKGNNIASYCEQFERVLGEGRLAFDEQQFTTNFPSVKDSRERLRDELLRIGKDERGKIHGKHDGECDDLAISLLQAVYWITVIMSQSAYREQLQNAPAHFETVLTGIARGDLFF